MTSGMKRTLAYSAVSAMALTGVPLLAGSAQADPLPTGPTALYGVDLGIASVRDHATVSLVATDANPAVTKMVLKAGADTIATATRDSDNVFTTEWAPPAGLYNTTVTVTAQGQDNLGNDVGAPATQTVLVDPGADTIDLADPAAAIGLFTQPYAAAHETQGALAGTTSAADGALVLLRGLLPAAHTPGFGFVKDHKFTAKVNATGYTFDTTDPEVDQLLVGAGIGVGATDGRDAQVVDVYEATIGSIGAVAKTPNVQAGHTSDVVVTVEDQKGNPVVGAEVAQDGVAGAEQYTDVNGEATFAALPAGSYRFYANTTGASGYDNGVDYKSGAVEITSYSATPGTAEATSEDGGAFDVDELTAGDLGVKVTDQNDAALAGESFFYSWDYVPANPSTTDKAKSFDMGHVVTGADGKADLSLPPVTSDGGTYTLKGYVNLDGTPDQGDGDLAANPLKVSTGESSIKFDDADPAQRQAGTVQTFTGYLSVAGKSLGNRDLALTWTAAGDAKVAAQGDQPAGTTRSGNTSATTKTAGDGSFSVAINDPAGTTGTPLANETGDQLTAAGTVAGVGTDATKTVTVDFLKNVTAATIDETASNKLIDGLATPGRPVTKTVHVENSDGVALANASVKLTTDHGFFTKLDAAGDLVPATAAAQDGLFGDWKNNGATMTVKTDAGGDATFTVAIARDADFDDGAVTSTITAEVGSTTNAAPMTVDWQSTDALNPGAVKLTLDADQDVEVLPKASTRETVYLDVAATDQFGNLTAATVDLSDDAADTEINGSSTDTVPTDFTDSPTVVDLDSDDTVDQTVTGKWDADTNTWIDGDTATAGFQATRTTDLKVVSGDAAAVNWYTVDFNASKYTITTADGSTSYKKGDTVKLTYKAVDQNGEPISDLDPAWFRTGPDDYQDGTAWSSPNTNEDGESTFIFQGAKAGTAIVDVVVRDDMFPSPVLIPAAEQSETLTFSAPVAPVVREKINATLWAVNGRTGMDLVVVDAHNKKAAGTVVRIYRVNPNGTIHLIRSPRLDANGKVLVGFKDYSRGHGTRYVAVVNTGPLTLWDTTNVDWVW